MENQIDTTSKLEPVTNTRIGRKAHQLLKLLAVVHNMTMTNIVDDLVIREASKYAPDHLVNKGQNVATLQGELEKLAFVPFDKA